MTLLDVNVLIYAFWTGAPHHEAARRWLDVAVIGDEPVVVPDVAVSGFIRILTGGRMFAVTEPLEPVLSFVRWLTESPAVLVGHGGSAHITIFCDLCEKVRATGNAVSDAYLVAMALERGATLVSFDADFARFPGLSWQHLPGNQVVLNP